MSCTNIPVPSVDPSSECSEGHNCDQLCVRVGGVETCGCYLGYSLASDQSTCNSKFRLFVCTPSQTITHTLTLHTSSHFKHTRTDVNECEENPCGQICTDLEGGYECSCGQGYRVMLDGSCEGTFVCI